MNRFKAIRKRVFAMTQVEFAEVLGVSQPAVSRWENGTVTPDYESMCVIRDLAYTLDIRWRDEWFFCPIDLIPKLPPRQ